MKKLPIGISDFQKLLEGGYYYVDKTMLIKDVVDLPGEVKLITRPRRFGKTLGMSMMEHFFSVFRKGNLFDGLAIWKEKGLVKDYYHRFPVIFVSFKEIKDVNWKSALNHIKRALSNLVKRFIGVIRDEHDRMFLESVLRMDATESDYMDVLRYLTEALHREVREKAILLIDEYDVPLEAAYTYRRKDPDYYDNMVAFMRNMLVGALKDNEHLELGVLSGVYRVAKESIFSGLNNLAVYTVFENEMSDRFGFTEGEVAEMASHYGLSEEDKRTIDEWYGGFTVGMSTLYNPWSVIYYIKERVFGGRDSESAAQPFWINTSSNDLIIEQIEGNPEVQSRIDSLLEGKEVTVRMDPWLSLRELEDREEGVWVLFVSSGYLSAKRVRGNRYSLRIPNEEVLEFFKGVVKEWVRKRTGLRMEKMVDALDEMLIYGRHEAFARHLEDFLMRSLSYYDVGGDEPERFYKGFLLGILSITVNGYTVESEMESGYGRLDVVVYPKKREYGMYAAIFELKRSDDEKELKEQAEKALNQIKRRKYYEKIKGLGYGVVAFGIAFSGKKVEMRVERI